jgi:serpin B
MRLVAGGSGHFSLARQRTVIGVVCVFALGFNAALGGNAVARSGDTASEQRRSIDLPQTALRPALATGALGLDFMRTTPGNLVLSPDSVAAALAMTGMGGVGPTAREIAQTLHLRGLAAFAAVGDLQRAIANGQVIAGEGDPDPPALAIANGLFLQQGLPVEPAFLTGLAQHFGATPGILDFQGDPTGALDAINGWVSDYTRGVVPRILDSLPENMVLALANAVYFKAAWRHPFKPRETSPGLFFKSKTRTTIPFMHQTEELPYGSGRGYRAVALPYRSSTLSLLVVLPVRKRLGSLLHRLSATGLARIARSLSPRSVMLSLPRFHLNTQADLAGTLRRLGMPTAFSDAADFSRITAATPLKIDFVKHVADFTVDEEGTLAAAATVVGTVATSGPGIPIDPVKFNANRPFLFFLRDNRTGAVLFSGRLTDPASAGA